jgi:hypothetical protein
MVVNRAYMAAATPQLLWPDMPCSRAMMDWHTRLVDQQTMTTVQLGRIKLGTLRCDVASLVRRDHRKSKLGLRDGIEPKKELCHDEVCVLIFDDPAEQSKSDAEAWCETRRTRLQLDDPMDVSMSTVV